MDLKIDFILESVAKSILVCRQEILVKRYAFAVAN